jgi:putative SOS response-associated peptidase YedK
MCGRFTLIKEKKEIEKHFDAEFTQKAFYKNYNTAPGSMLPVITNQAPEYIQYFQWGLVPSWVNNSKIAFKTINARVETIRQKPAFKNAFAKRRCLIPADSYYEWKKEGDNKVPYRITIDGGALFAFAGIWETWKRQDEIMLHSFSIITIPATPKISHLHDRMPVILSRYNEKNWLDHDLNEKDAISLLNAPAPKNIDYYTVSKKINTVANNEPSLITPFNHQIQGSLF